MVKKRILAACTAILCVACAILAVSLYTAGLSRTPLAIAGDGAQITAHGVGYDSVTEANYPKKVSESCTLCGGEAYRITTTTELAAVFKYCTGIERLKACYVVTLPESTAMDFTDWSTLLITGTFRGHFDFNNITIQKPVDGAGSTGIFNVIDGAVIKNLNILQPGDGITFAQTVCNHTVIDNINATVRHTNTFGYGSGFLLNLFESTAYDCNVSYVLRSDQDKSLYAAFTASFGGFTLNARNAVFTDCNIAFGPTFYSFNNIGGGMINGATGENELYRCSIDFSTDEGYAKRTTNINGFGGIVRSCSSGKFTVDRCTVTMDFAAMSLNSAGFIALCSNIEINITNSTLNGDQMIARTDRAAGFIARVNDGETTINLKNCVSDLKEICANAVFFGVDWITKHPTVVNVTIDRCINYTNAASGKGLLSVFVAGINGADVTNVKITNCVNYGKGTNSVYGYTITARDAEGASQLSIENCYDASSTPYLVNSVGQYVHAEMSGCTHLNDKSAIWYVNAGGENITGTSVKVSEAQPEPDPPYTVDPITVTATYGDVSTFSLTFTGEDFAGYRVKDLYISVDGDTANAYTQLIHAYVFLTDLNGKKLGSKDQECTGTLTFSYASHAGTLGNLYLKMTVTKGGIEKQLTISGTGILTVT